MTTLVFVVAAATSATGSASPALVKTSVIALRMSVLSLEGELLGMDQAGGNLGPAHVPFERVGHRGRAADVDLALGDVRHELAQVAGREEAAAGVSPVIADHEEKSHAAFARKPLELLAEDDVAVVDDAVDDDDVAAHVLHQRADRCDADAARNEQDLLPFARSLGEDTERPFGDHAGAWLETAETAREVAERRDGDAQRVGGRRWRKRER